MEGIKRALADVVRNGSQDYHRSFVAHYEGQRAGLVVLKFPGDVDADGINNITDYISCCGACGLLCMSRIIGNESVPPGHCYIDHICVDASFRGKGIGKALMEVADSYARKRGCHTMYLYVACDNRAKNLYERQGFKVLEDEDGCCLSWCAVGVRHFYRMGKPL